ncbi:MAG: sulfotransferase [Pirellulaceae bacterium]|nr:sulfotransferase [Pirellulaceae bacterium]
MRENSCRPAFFVVGGSRCGTTSLHHALVHHPGIFVPRNKSPNYFTAEDLADFPGSVAMAAMKGHAITNESEYLELFASAADGQLPGEVSPVYLQSINTAGRISAFAPEARIVAILRDPVDRAFAHYIGRRRDGLESRTSFAEVIAPELADRGPKSVAFNQYLAIGRYAHFLKSFYREFPAERIKLLFFDDLVHDPIEVLQELFAFLGVEQLGDRLPLEQKNRGGIIRNPLLRAVWTRSALLRARLRQHIPETVRDSVGRTFLANMRRPTLEASIHRDLTEYFADSLSELKAFCGDQLGNRCPSVRWLHQIEMNRKRADTWTV